MRLSTGKLASFLLKTAKKYVSYLLGIAVALAIFSVILVAFRYNPFTSMAGLVTGSFGSVFLASETFVLMTPFLLAALAFLVAYRARFYNIGVEGQLYIGALFAYLVGSQLGGLPSIIAIPLVVIASALGGVLWLALPLVMRVKLRINEIFPTLVMNFVALDVINWLTAGPIKDPNSGNLQTAMLPRSTWLPVLIPGTRFNLGIIFAVLAAIGVFFILYKTVIGYEIRASGTNPQAARGGGIDVSRSIIAVGLISGSLAGMAGMVAVTGAQHILAQNFSPGYGYQGLAVAAVGSFHPLGALVSSVLYSALSIGGESLQRSAAALPIELIYVLQAVIVLSVLIVQRVLSRRTKWRL
jgi:general nucleoside transport system permease protein